MKLEVKCNVKTYIYNEMRKKCTQLNYIQK